MKLLSVNIMHGKCVKKEHNGVLLLLLRHQSSLCLHQGLVKVQNILPTKCLYETGLSTQL